MEAGKQNISAQMAEKINIRRRALLESTRHNVEEYRKFFMAAYGVETDEIAPMSLKEVFGDLEIPDIRKPGQSLEELYPHYLVRIMDVRDPEYASHKPYSPEYTAEMTALNNLVRQMHAKQKELNERSLKQCMQMYGEQI